MSVSLYTVMNDPFSSTHLNGTIKKTILILGYTIPQSIFPLIYPELFRRTEERIYCILIPSCYNYGAASTLLMGALFKMQNISKNTLT